jgi:hypothetical protein
LVNAERWAAVSACPTTSVVAPELASLVRLVLVAVSAWAPAPASEPAVLPAQGWAPALARPAVAQEPEVRRVPVELELPPVQASVLARSPATTLVRRAPASRALGVRLA